MSTAARDAPWPERRFSQAIAEGDGISLIPVVGGDVARLAAAAEAAGAEAVLVESIADVKTAREATAVPVVAALRTLAAADLEAARADGADAVAISAASLLADDASAYAHAVELGLDCAIRVDDEDELQLVLETLEPEIVVASLDGGSDGDRGEGLALLTDVPVGKLVVVETESATRDSVVALESAGVDALVVEAPSSPDDLEQMLRELIGAEHPLA